MAIQTTTFKGARYIVKFHDPIQWSATESYEAIEAVQYNAFTYISKQPVPAGVQIDNEAFWLLWADPNAQMEQLRQLVDEYADQVETLSGTVQDLSNDVEGFAAIIPAEDFSAVNTVKKYIDFDASKAHVFATVADMKSADTLSVGTICHTCGFNTAGDNGAAWYVIEDTGTADEMGIIACGELFAHFIQTESFVSPEMFGAIGDGIVDDIAAINYAVGEFKNIRFMHDSYKISSAILVTESNKQIDFNGCDIICTGDTAVQCVNAFDDLQYSGAYAAGSSNFAISDGLKRMTSQTVVMPGRDYYIGGMVFKNKDGIASCALPYELAAVDVYGQTNDLGNIRFENIGDVSVVLNGNNRSYGFNLSGVHDVVVSGCNTHTNAYSFVNVQFCSNITIEKSNITVNCTYSNSYGVSFAYGTTNSIISNCYIENKSWHAVTTGGEETNVNISVIDSELVYSGNSDVGAYADHGNTINTLISNCIVNQQICIADGTVENCTIINNTSVTQHPNISFMAWLGNVYHSQFCFKNIRFVGSTVSRIRFLFDIQNTSQEAYDCIIDRLDVYDCISNASAGLAVGFASSTLDSRIASLVFNETTIKDCGLVTPSHLECCLKSVVENCIIRGIFGAGATYITAFGTNKSKCYLKDCDFIAYIPNNAVISEMYIASCYSQYAQQCNVTDKFFAEDFILDAECVTANWKEAALCYFKGYDGTKFEAYKPAGSTTVATKATPNGNWA